jgi:Mo-dependent nitrogenase C-terminus
MNSLDHDHQPINQDIALVSWIWINQPNVDRSSEKSADSTPIQPINSTQTSLDLLRPFRRWLDQIEVRNADLARRLCKFIPSQCPFERTIKLFDRTLLRIPPLCKLNPLYDEVVALRFRALCYLADECGEDVSSYC